MGYSCIKRTEKTTSTTKVWWSVKKNVNTGGKPSITKVPPQTVKVDSCKGLSCPTKNEPGTVAVLVATIPVDDYEFTTGPIIVKSSQKFPIIGTIYFVTSSTTITKVTNEIAYQYKCVPADLKKEKEKSFFYLRELQEAVWPKRLDRPVRKKPAGKRKKVVGKRKKVVGKRVVRRKKVAKRI